MEQKIKDCCATIFSALLLSGSILNAQDTVRIKETTVDTVRIKRTTVDTVQVQKSAVVHDTVTKAGDSNTLHKGEFGLRYLPTFTSLSIRNSNGDAIEGEATLSNGFGIMLAHNFSKCAGMQLEINYDKISQKYKDGELDRQVSINYINIPLLLAVNTDKTMPVVFGVVLGPQFGINIGSSFSGTNGSNSNTLHAVLAVKQGDVGVAYGAGLGIALNPKRSVRLDLGFRGMFGLVDMSGAPAGDNAYNILVKGSRKSYGGHAGIAFLF